uniref:Uncharacterized protein n=1 Tax=Meloidogyne enterolobii TaxID=390850 RepID=A0A6V7UFZ6_MELEN|nr:unnamed protein product [Meloidogyne enterolobii]
MVYILVPITSGNQFSLLLYGIIPSVLLNTASASTAPILYINCNDYNKAYKKEFKLIKRFIFKLLRIKDNTITTTTTTVF